MLFYSQLQNKVKENLCNNVARPRYYSKEYHSSRKQISQMLVHNMSAPTYPAKGIVLKV